MIGYYPQPTWYLKEQIIKIIKNSELKWFTCTLDRDSSTEQNYSQIWIAQLQAH